MDEKKALRPEYYYRPSLDTLRESFHDGVAKIDEGLTIGRLGYGGLAGIAGRSMGFYFLTVPVAPFQAQCSGAVPSRSTTSTRSRTSFTSEPERRWSIPTIRRSRRRGRS